MRLRVEYRYIVDRGLLLQIDAPDLAMERHTLVRGSAAVRVPRVGRSRDRRRSTTRSTASIATGFGCTSAGATTKALTRSTCRSRRSSVALYRADVGALVALDGQRTPRARVRVLLRCARSPKVWCSSRASSTRRATTSSTRMSSPTASCASPRPSVIRSGSSPGPIVDSTRRRGSVTSHRRSCGRSSAHSRGGHGERPPLLTTRVWRQQATIPVAVCRRNLAGARREGRRHEVRGNELVGCGRTERGDERNDAGPVRQPEIVGVLDRWTSANLGRRFGDRQAVTTRVVRSSDCVRPSTSVGPSGQGVIDDLAQRHRSSRRASSTDTALADDHHRAIVHRVMERRAREHQPVDDGHRDAHVGAGRRARAASRCRTAPWR